VTHGSPAADRSKASSAGSASRSSTAQGTGRVGATVLKRAGDLADQAAFLWTSRSFVGRSSAVTVAALASVDDRISRLVTALSERPGLAEHLLAADHSPFASGHVFVTAAVAVRSGTGAVVDELVKRLEGRDALLSPLASALAWFDYNEVSDLVEHLLASSEAPVIRLGLMAAVAHGFDPGAPLEAALEAKDPMLRATALEATGRLGAADLRPRLRASLQDDDDACRFWAAWSAVRLGDRSGLPVLGRFAVASGPFARPACDLALRALEPGEAVRAQTRFTSAAADKRLGVFAAGIVGDPALAGWLFNQMKSAALARHAGAAFCLMTGRDLRRNDLEGPPLQPLPEVTVDTAHTASAAAEEEAGVATEPDAERGWYALDELDDFVWPDPGRIQRWWAREGHAFAPGERYLGGLPIRRAELMQLLRTGNQRQRAAAALELALLNPDEPLLDVVAPVHRQMFVSGQL
jgi:uncharacterized protein (TIGR02270 family)